MIFCLLPHFFNLLLKMVLALFGAVRSEKLPVKGHYCQVFRVVQLCCLMSEPMLASSNCKARHQHLPFCISNNISLTRCQSLSYRSHGLRPVPVAPSQLEMRSNRDLTRLLQSSSPWRTHQNIALPVAQLPSSLTQCTLKDSSFFFATNAKWVLLDATLIQNAFMGSSFSPLNAQ